ncbi:hypothetical protein [Mycolicibacterium cosmeticum]|uniref:hypothetical protein n=1 Tax=Mycolicibacterium cosmeticum TaxID=258533 RepID=UPI003204F7E0
MTDALARSSSFAVVGRGFRCPAEDLLPRSYVADGQKCRGSGLASAAAPGAGVCGSGPMAGVTLKVTAS